jgi:hypothetical protein
MLWREQRGRLAELAIADAAVRLGVGISKPLWDERYDLILDLHPRLVRVQCKSAVRRGDVVVVRCRSCRRGPNGMLQRPYTEEEVDFIAAYCPEFSRAYLVPPELFGGHSTMIHLRLARARNNQKLGIHWATDYEFAAKLSELKGP